MAEAELQVRGIAAARATAMRAAGSNREAEEEARVLLEQQGLISKADLVVPDYHQRYQGHRPITPAAAEEAQEAGRAAVEGRAEAAPGVLEREATA